MNRPEQQDLVKAALDIARALIDAEIPRRRAESLKKAEMLATGLVADLVAIQQPEPQDEPA